MLNGLINDGSLFETCTLGTPSQKRSASIIGMFGMRNFRYRYTEKIIPILSVYRFSFDNYKGKFFKGEVKSVLRIGSAHNNVRTSNVNIAQISNVSNFSEHKLYSYSFRSIANQNGVRYSDSTSYFKKYSNSKCKQTVCLHYGLDFPFNGSLKEILSNSKRKR